MAIRTKASIGASTAARKPQFAVAVDLLAELIAALECRPFTPEGGVEASIGDVFAALTGKRPNAKELEYIVNSWK